MEDLTGDRQLLGRLVDRLRAMTELALVKARGELDGQSVAGAVHELCAWAALRQGIGEPLPVLHPFGTGDQLAVVGREFLDWAGSAGDEPALEHWRREVQRLRSAT